MLPRKILIVEDSKLLHKMYEVMLSRYGLVHAYDGREGLQKLGEHPDIDLVLLDVNMPNMNGLEFLNQMRANSAFDDTAVIIISTEGKEEDTRRGLEGGAAAYITKPFQKEDILEVIANLEAGSMA